MTERIKHADRLERIQKRVHWSHRESDAIGAGAADLREIEAMENIPHEVECATFVLSDEPRRESTVTLPLSEWKQLRAQRDAIAAEAVRLRESLEEVTGNYRGGANNALEDPYVMERAQSALTQTAAAADRYRARLRAEVLVELIEQCLPGERADVEPWLRSKLADAADRDSQG